MTQDLATWLIQNLCMKSREPVLVISNPSFLPLLNFSPVHLNVKLPFQCNFKNDHPSKNNASRVWYLWIKFEMQKGWVLHEYFFKKILRIFWFMHTFIEENDTKPFWLFCTFLPWIFLIQTSSVSGVSLSLDKQKSMLKSWVVILHEGEKDTSKGRYLYLITKETFLFWLGMVMSGVEDWLNYILQLVEYYYHS